MNVRDKPPYLPYLEIPKPVLFSDPKQLYLKLIDNGWFQRIDTTKADEMIRFWETQKKLAQMDAMRKRSLRNRKKGAPLPESLIPSSGSFRNMEMDIVWEEDEFPKEPPRLERRNAVCVPEEELKSFNPLNPDHWNWSNCPAMKELDEEELSRPILFRQNSEDLLEPKTPRPLHDIGIMLELREPEGPESRLTSCPVTPGNSPDEILSLDSLIHKLDWEALGAKEPDRNPTPKKRLKMF